MRIKIIFLFFTLGGVAVLAEKESTGDTGISGEEEKSKVKENENGFDVNLESNDGSIHKVKLQSSSEPPTLPLKLKNKENVLWSRTEQLLTKFIEKGYQIFFKMEKKVIDKKENYEDSMKSNFETAEQTLEVLKEELEKGKNTTEFQKCFYGFYYSFEVEVTKSMESSFNCFDNALEVAKDFLEQFRDVFKKIFEERFEEIREQTMISKSCEDQKKKCIKQRLENTNQKIEEMVNATNSLIKKAEDALRVPKTDMDDCYDEFLQKLNASLNTCIISMKSCGSRAKSRDDTEDKGKVEDDKKEQKEKTKDDKEEEEEKVEDDQKEEGKIKEEIKEKGIVKVDKKEKAKVKDGKEEKAKFEEKR